jgi:hypothetical protein
MEIQQGPEKKPAMIGRLKETEGIAGARSRRPRCH